MCRHFYGSCIGVFTFYQLLGPMQYVHVVCCVNYLSVFVCVCVCVCVCVSHYYCSFVL